MKEIRRLTSEDYNNAKEILNYSFGDLGDSLEDYWNHSKNYGFFQKGKCTSQISVTPFELYFYGKKIKANGIGCVASTPETRGNGSIRKLFEEILQQQKENGVVLSVLAPFSYSFYQQFQYECIYQRMLMSWCTEEFPRGEKSGYCIQRVSYEEAKPVLQKLYEAEFAHHPLSLVREEWWWDYSKMGREPQAHYAIVSNEQGEPRGYLIYLFEGRKFRIREIIAQDNTAFQSLLRFIHSHSASFDEIYYKNPISAQNQNLFQVIAKEKKNTELQPYMQARIVDFPLFLSVYPFKHPAHFAFEVKDEGANWNNGLFLSNGEKISNYEGAVLSGDIKAFTKLLCGVATLKTLVFLGEITLNREEKIEEMADCFTGEQAVLADFF